MKNKGDYRMSRSYQRSYQKLADSPAAGRWFRRLILLMFGVLIMNSQRIAAASEVAGWGQRPFGNYGQAVVPEGLSDVVAVSAGGHHSMALKGDGTVAVWGLGDNGEANIPAGLTNVKQVSAGNLTSYALRHDGSVVAWGSNNSGQTDVPADLADVVEISAGGLHCLALKRDGTVVAWGWNDYGQTTVPAGLSSVVAVSAGYYHSLALKADGTVAGWGLSGFAQTDVPHDLSGVKAISAGSYHNLALRNDGTVAAWKTTEGGPHSPAADFGNLNIPEGLSDVVAVDCGYWFSMALKADGTIVMWGDTTGNANVVPPEGLSNVAGISGGGSHCLARIVTRQEIEARSTDFGLLAAGFSNNSAYDSLSFGGGSLIRAVRGNPADASKCIYTNSLVLPASSTLDLNGIRLYARVAQIAGTVINGTVLQIPDSGPLALNGPAPGVISEAGQLDEWTFHGRVGDTVTVALNTGGNGVLAPALNHAEATLTDPSGKVAGRASNNTPGQAVLLPGRVLPANGIYRVHVRAAPAHAGNVGNYQVSVWETAPDVLPLVLNQQHAGRIANPYNVDRWTFTGSPGQQVRMNLANVSAAGVVFTLQGPNGWTGFDRISTSSDLVSLPSADSYTLVAEGSGGPADISYAFRLEETQQTELQAGVPHTGQFSGDGQARMFRMQVADAGPLELVLQNSGTGNRTEMYAARGVPPTRRSHEFSSASNSQSNRGLRIPSASPGTWYVLVYADKVQTPGEYVLEARMPGVILEKLSAGSQVGTAPFELTISGAGFRTDTTVQLVSSNGTVYGASSVTADSYTRLSVTFPPNAAPPGTYDVRVSLPGGGTVTLPGSFVVLPAGSPKLETKLILPGTLGRDTVATLYVEYANTGTAPMPAPLLILQSADPDGSDRPVLTLDGTRLPQSFWSGHASLPPGTSTQALIHAGGSQPGVLNPGERLQVPVHFLGLLQPWNLSDNSVELEIRYWTEDDQSPIDWTARKEMLRPPTLEPAVWNAIHTNLTGETGTTSAYVRMLNDNAKFLGRIGIRTPAVEDLWALELQKAYGHSAVPVLDSVIDAAVGVPGVPLELPRQFSSNLISRNAVGMFGQGWFTPWQTKLEAEGNGARLTLVGESGSTRVFSRDTRSNRYFPGAGDGAEMVPAGGTYELREPDGTVTRFLADGRIDYLQDANANRVSATWSGTRLISLNHTSGASIGFFYGENGFISQVVESTGRTVSYIYDGAYLVTATTADGKKTSYTYEQTGTAARLHTLKSVSRAGLTRNFSWDGRGRLASTSLGAGEEITSFTYGNAGGITVTQAGATTSLFFNQLGQLSKIVDPLGNITTAEFNGDHRLSRLIFPTGESQSYTWCRCGSPISITDELGHVVRFSYDHPLKKMTSSTDGKGNTTRYTYDARGNLLNTIHADGSVESHSDFNSAGLPQTETNRRGQAIQYSWTASGEVARQTFADGSHNDLTYDARGNLTRVTEHPASGAEKITTYTYAHVTDGDRLKKVDYPDGKWVEYFHDSDGRRERMTDSAGGNTRYEYDTAARLSKLRDAANAVIIEYLYDAAGRLQRINKGNGTHTTYQYDAAGQLLHLINYAPGGAANSRFDYTYDSRGRRTAMTTLDGKWTYTYDATGQLTHAVFVTAGQGISNQDLRYYYDAAGNRTSTVRNGVTTVYASNAMNQYSNVGGSAQLYDADGNLTSDGEWNFEYDLLSRMVRATGHNGVTEYEYNAQGHRTAAIYNGKRTEYLFDPTGWGHVLEQITPAGVKQRFSHGVGLAARSSGDGGYEYFDGDAQGSVANVSRTDGGTDGRYIYGPFGEIQQAPPGVSNPFQYIGQLGVMREEAGENWMRARFFSSRQGRFVSRDPLGLEGGDVNIYRYVHNSPANFEDPIGLFYDRQMIEDMTNGNPEGIMKGYERTKQRIGAVCFAVGAADKLNILGFVTGGAKGWGKGIIQNAAADQIAGPLGADCLPPLPNKDNSVPGGGGPGEQGDKGSSTIPAAMDPNEKIGPGAGAEGWMQADTLMPYRINFENIGPGSKDPAGNPYPVFATAPAQRVTISDPLESTLDWSTFQITDFGFGDIVVPVPAGTSHYTGSVPVTRNGQTFVVEVEAGIDFSTGQIFVRFQSMNPDTGLPPPVLTGFLPPEDGTGTGMGHFSYTIRTRENLPTNTQIRNIAYIKFDVNQIIATNDIDPLDASKGTDPDKEALVTLDRDDPVSSVEALPSATDSPDFIVSWSGTDIGAGIANYDIYCSVNGGLWKLWLKGTTATSALFHGEFGERYGFLSVARDNSGNVQATPAEIQSSTLVTVDWPNLHVGYVPGTGQTPPHARLTYKVESNYRYIVEYSDDLGLGQPWQPLPGAPHTTGRIIDPEGVTKRFYRLIREKQ